MHLTDSTGEFIVPPRANLNNNRNNFPDAGIHLLQPFRDLYNNPEQGSAQRLSCKRAKKCRHPERPTQYALKYP